ncbi:S-layer homology domain-containing protein [Dolichospermum circinale CS-534/05]|uniref:S-layer homology domain-containing protein n=1 Tax=Dolichospermum circinale TaxID=109265 RepID=UPI00232F1169|nr:S-layer homology domain-containing protein [Dolichospermum circinale]MDB9455642.1 S-layer homology domain-containing protein [Dolichospermum circinale CS-541/06]MDB9461594.1 S-layer homology domain-containing protein [Dolichospermum circinale CS-541/04]MDB9489860.1 S-layer homology domain-containing protein [Dolichospermum circinale CS-534/05]MDB9547752.1 S-layer homology domain-containing protein [Dolichospermum circinale CS-1031]
MFLRNYPAAFLSLAVLLSSLTACTNNPSAKNLEQSLAADPRLQNTPVPFAKPTSQQVTPDPNTSTIKLPADFPPEIPIYPNAELEEVTPANSENKISIRWQSADPSNLITSFYRQQFQAQNWLVQQPEDDVQGTFTARRNDLLITVTIQPQTVTKAAPNQPQTATKLLIEYSSHSQTTATNSVTSPDNPQFVGPVLPKTNNTKIVTQPTSKSETLATSEFIDIQKVPPEWRSHIQDLALLGVFSSDPKTTQEFLPDKIITRREYARWLVNANNTMYSNNPAKQIRLASPSTQPAFRDILSQDGDFPLIQGLAEAGLINSILSGDATAVLFRPDAPLTREQLLLWKVPLDTRQALPSANLEAVKQTWGFQDAGNIEPKALKAILADFQNAEQSNIRRVFGYTTLFQPKKPVTRAEAGAALWYFGTQGEGISATEALKLKN